MARIARMVLTSLSLFLGMFFFFFGLIKVSKSLNSDIHREMRRNFVRYAKVVPLLATRFNWKISPKFYRLLVGYSEIVAGLLLAFCPGLTKQLMNLFLICLTIGALYTHITIGDDFNRMIPAIAFCSMLTTRFILYCLLKRIGDDDYESGFEFVPLQQPETKPKKIQQKTAAAAVVAASSSSLVDNMGVKHEAQERQNSEMKANKMNLMDDQQINKQTGWSFNIGWLNWFSRPPASAYKRTISMSSHESSDESAMVDKQMKQLNAAFKMQHNRNNPMIPTSDTNNNNNNNNNKPPMRKHQKSNYRNKHNQSRQRNNRQKQKNE